MDKQEILNIVDELKAQNDIEGLAKLMNEIQLNSLIMQAYIRNSIACIAQMN